MGNLLTHTVAHAAHKKGLFDLRLGFQMFRRQDVSGTLKLGSISIGILLTFLLALLEIPLESVVAFFLPFLGVAIDTVFDGAEFMLLPVIFASALLPLLVTARSKREQRRLIA